jgi:uncharacterized membrane protein YczE
MRRRSVGEERESRSDRREWRSVTLGIAIAFGVGLGTVVFAFTGEAIWIAIGPALGVVVGAAIGYRDD